LSLAVEFRELSSFESSPRNAAYTDCRACVGVAGGGAEPNVSSLCERVHRSLDYEWGITGVETTEAEAVAGRP
jgi:hypothetical protein